MMRITIDIEICWKMVNVPWYHEGQYGRNVSHAWHYGYARTLMITGMFQIRRRLGVILKLFKKM
ncbi:MAG: hypothetical protein CM15mP102_03940 [Flavobacteriales bacterium]|nr:MAG: hypothetical protein CM15mP102_03940 [Flavobacteriales bacterium]